MLLIYPAVRQVALLSCIALWIGAVNKHLNGGLPSKGANISQCGSFIIFLRCLQPREHCSTPIPSLQPGLAAHASIRWGGIAPLRLLLTVFYPALISGFVQHHSAHLQSCSFPSFSFPESHCRASGHFVGIPCLLTRSNCRRGSGGGRLVSIILN